MGGGCGTESGGQLDIYTEHRANRTFDILDVGLRERGVKDDFLEFQPEQLNEQQCHFRGRSLLLGEGDQEFVLGILSLSYLVDIQVQMPRRQIHTNGDKI